MEETLELIEYCRSATFIIGQTLHLLSFHSNGQITPVSPECSFWHQTTVSVKVQSCAAALMEKYLHALKKPYTAPKVCAAPLPQMLLKPESMSGLTDACVACTRSSRQCDADETTCLNLPVGKHQI